MLFRNQPSGVLAISQIAHAWLSGQLLRAWDENHNEPLLLAAEQHDIGWLDWETAPSFNPDTGRPHLFREIGAAAHAPMWTRGVERALAGWGAHVALLISLHGGVIYRRYTDRHRVSDADSAAAQEYLERQAPIEAAWAKALGLDTAALDRERSLVAFREPTIDPTDDIATHEIAHEQEEAVRGLVQPAVAQVMSRQRTLRLVLGVGAYARALPISAILESPIACELGAIRRVG